jgi:[acyl-carrier-protein] S-malonyltransferase
MQKIAFLFSGQGSQYVGMGQSLFQNFKIARLVFEQANDVLDFDLQTLCFEGNTTELTRTENAQPAILTVSIAALHVYMQEFDSPPVCMAGHSLGEITALTAAGAIKFTDALQIVRQRGQYMQEAVALGSGAMSAVSGVSADAIETVCRQCSNYGEVVVISNYNSAEQIVISGHESAVNRAGSKLNEAGGTVVPLRVSAPFHSPLMQPAASKLNETLQAYTYRPLVWPVVSNVTALPYRSEADIVDNLTTQMTRPVRWDLIIEYLRNQGVQIAVELGPQTILRNLMRKSQPEIASLSYDREEDVEELRRVVNFSLV